MCLHYGLSAVIVKSSNGYYVSLIKIGNSSLILKIEMYILVLWMMRYYYYAGGVAHNTKYNTKIRFHPL